MKTLGIIEAAELLRMSEDALMRKARAGIVPASKPGRQWVFLEEDLRAYLVKLMGERACRSIANLKAPTGGFDSVSAASKLDAALARLSEQRLKSTKRALEQIYGGKPSSASGRATPGQKRSSAGTPRLRVVGGTATRSG